MQFVAPGPGRIGSLAVLLDAIPASRADIAAHLGVSVRTLHTYAATDLAPRSVKVALFVESGFGRQQINTSAHNDAVMWSGMADCLRRDVATLQARIAYLERVGDFGAANAPSTLLVAATAARPVGLQVAPQLGQA